MKKGKKFVEMSSKWIRWIYYCCKMQMHKAFNCKQIDALAETTGKVVVK